MRRIFFITIFVSGIFFITFSQYSSAGVRVFPFLNLDYDSRTISMGGISTAMPNELYGAFYNPASFGYIEKKQAVCGYRSIIEDVWAVPLGFAMPFSSYGVFGISLIDVSFGTLSEVTENFDGTPFSTGAKWRSFAVVGGLTWANVVWESLSIGATLKGIYDYIGKQGEHYTADAVALQVGLQYRWLNSRLIAGLVINNLGFMVKEYSEQTENLKLPFSVSAGISYIPKQAPALRIGMDLKQAIDDFLVYKLGIEYAIYKKYVFIRAGYSLSEQDLENYLKILKGENIDTYQKTNWNGFSCGVGFNTNIGITDLGIDAFIQFRENIDPAFGISLLAGF